MRGEKNTMRESHRIEGEDGAARGKVEKRVLASVNVGAPATPLGTGSAPTP
jgi:hypothetical protein